jgi:hypothetical protein
MQAVGKAQGVEPQARPCGTLWDRFLRAYCIVLAIIAVACFFLAITVRVPWPRSTLGQIVLALILGLIGLRALASMLARLGGTLVLEGFLKSVVGDDIAEAKRLHAILENEAVNNAKVLPPREPPPTAAAPVAPPEPPQLPPEAVEQNDVAGAERADGTVRLPITVGERLDGLEAIAKEYELDPPILRPPGAANAVYGVVLGVFGVILITIAAAEFVRNLYLLVRDF